jgi:hypothetical protein
MVFILIPPSMVSEVEPLAGEESNSFNKLENRDSSSRYIGTKNDIMTQSLRGEGKGDGERLISMRNAYTCVVKNHRNKTIFLQVVKSLVFN